MGEKLPVLMRRIYHLTKVKPEYAVIVEAHESGEPHFHIPMRCADITKTQIKEWWRELTGAYIIDFQETTDVKGAAKYLSKYLGKELHKFGKFKRYWFSKGYVLPPVEGERLQPPDKTRCSWSREYPETIAWGYQRQGYYLLPEVNQRSTYTLLSKERYLQSFSGLDRREPGC